MYVCMYVQRLEIPGEVFSLQGRVCFEKSAWQTGEAEQSPVTASLYRAAKQIMNQMRKDTIKMQCLTACLSFGPDII